jgi:hypothetical protein
MYISRLSVPAALAMDRNSQLVAAAFSRMQERHGPLTRAAERLALVHAGVSG